MLLTFSRVGSRFPGSSQSLLHRVSIGSFNCVKGRQGRQLTWDAALMQIKYQSRSQSLSFSSNTIATRQSSFRKPQHLVLSSSPSGFRRHFSGRRDPTLAYYYLLRSIVPVIIATCAGVLFWRGYKEADVTNHGSKSARRDLNWYSNNMILSLRNMREGRWWTTVTSAFAHTDLLHLGVNMLALYSFGNNIVYLAGAKRFALLYLGSAAVGSLAQIGWWKSQGVSERAVHGAMGASGAISGLLGATAYLNPAGQIALFFIPMPIVVGVAAFATGSVACLHQGWLPGLGHADHCKFSMSLFNCNFTQLQDTFADTLWI